MINAKIVHRLMKFNWSFYLLHLRKEKKNYSTFYTMNFEKIKKSKSRFLDEPHRYTCILKEKHWITEDVWRSAEKFLERKTVPLFIKTKYFRHESGAYILTQLIGLLFCFASRNVEMIVSLTNSVQQKQHNGIWLFFSKRRRTKANCTLKNYYFIDISVEKKIKLKKEKVICWILFIILSTIQI